MQRAQIQLCDLPGAPLVSSRGIAAKHYISLPQTAENRTSHSWLIAKPPGSFCTSNLRLCPPPLICLHGSIPLKPVFLALGGGGISNSVCIDAIHTDQEAAPQGGEHHALHGPATAAGWVVLTSPALPTLTARLRGGSTEITLMRSKLKSSELH